MSLPVIPKFTLLWFPIGTLVCFYFLSSLLLPPEICTLLMICGLPWLAWAALKIITLLNSENAPRLTSFWMRYDPLVALIFTALALGFCNLFIVFVPSTFLIWLTVRKNPLFPSSFFPFFLTVLLSVSLIEFFFLSGGTGELFGIDHLTEAYDSLAASLLHGRADILPSSIEGEGLELRGKTYMYFGPFPALLRIPTLFAQELTGFWGRTSCLLASYIALLFFVGIMYEALESRPLLPPDARDKILKLLILAFGFGSPLFFLTCSASIFHESILWALAWSLGGIYFFLRFIERETVFDGGMLSICGGLTLLSRFTFGFPFAPLLLSCVIFQGIKKTHTFLLKSAYLGMPFFCMLVFQLWYNKKRFNWISVFASVHLFEEFHPKPFEYKMLFLYFLACPVIVYSIKTLLKLDFSLRKTIAVIIVISILTALMGYALSFVLPLSNIARLTTGVGYYFGFHTEYFYSTFPFITTIPSPYDGLLYSFDYNDVVISLFITAPWMVIVALTAIIRKFFWSGHFLFCTASLFFLSQVILICMFQALTIRYTAELLPFLILCIYGLLRYTPSASEQESLLTPTCKILVAFSIFATLASTTTCMMIYRWYTFPGFQMELQAVVPQIINFHS